MRRLTFHLAVLCSLTVAVGAAEESRHWAYETLRRPSVPVGNGNVRNPIDAFITAKLSEANRVAAPEADKSTLLRRVYFDLIGLPPTPDERKAFLADDTVEAYERTVDRLLASPRHGERWARHWMDVAHFAETHGHDQDRIRTNAWPYRDYLISAFNSDKPYADFLQEQVAGDILKPADPQATVALGFLAAGPWDESSLRDIREDTLDRQIARYVDRDDVVSTVMNTFASTTVQCARCHDHKFDPVPQNDYYALQAVFAGVDRANRTFDTDPKIHQARRALLNERDRLNKDRSWIVSRDVAREVKAFEEITEEARQKWRPILPESFVSTGGARLELQTDAAILAAGPRPERDTYVVTAVSPLMKISAVRLEVLTDESLPKRGPGRQENGNLHLSELELLSFDSGSTNARLIKFSSAVSDFDQSGWTVAHSVDGKDKTAWGIHPNIGESHQAVFKLEETLKLGQGTKLTFVLKQLHGEGHLIGKFRLSVTGEDSAAVTSALPSDIERILSIPEAGRSEDQQRRLAKFVVNRRINSELAALPKPSLVFAAASDFEPDGSHKPAGAPRPVKILKRGDIHKPIGTAEPGALSFISNLPSRFEASEEPDEGARRAALAKWLADPANHLTWRSIVNRVWHYHFGKGLVGTPNDFGRMGSVPTHPELLDWLAVWFRDDAKGSLKALHRLIVTSATYRQASTQNHGSSGTRGPSSRASLPPAQTDSDNRLLSHMNRLRLDADQVRDSILHIAGTLDLRMGGPSDRQFDLQPGHHVTPKVDYAKFDVTSSLAQRRSVYRFLFRTLPDPFMDALDCPAGDQLTPVRNASVTVQQALAMWNDAFVVSYASRVASRLEKHSNNVNEQVSLACELVWSRSPNELEQTELAAYVRAHGLANLCRVLFNSNEFMFVN